ncbi:MAG: hypothetical protein GF364_22250 [Candidatus Lokiarchaeota archaeon]|nr:hypothetical protein [Candidatus Lokiarchaeota archaeon]
MDKQAYHYYQQQLAKLEYDILNCTDPQEKQELEAQREEFQTLWDNNLGALYWRVVPYSLSFVEIIQRVVIFNPRHHS